MDCLLINRAAIEAVLVRDVFAERLEPKPRMRDKKKGSEPSWGSAFFPSSPSDIRGHDRYGKERRPQSAPFEYLEFVLM